MPSSRAPPDQGPSNNEAIPPQEIVAQAAAAAAVADDSEDESPHVRPDEQEAGRPAKPPSHQASSAPRTDSFPPL
mgnify:CR=1 FL=1